MQSDYWHQYFITGICCGVTSSTPIWYLFDGLYSRAVFFLVLLLTMCNTSTVFSKETNFYCCLRFTAWFMGLLLPSDLWAKSILKAFNGQKMN